jgi:NTE family protein
MTREKIGLVCSGGGARGAWEAGIIRYLREELTPDARQTVRFDILSGTSVGAMTACYLAATMDTPDEQGRGLASLWTSLSLEEVFKVAGQSAWSVGRKMWKATRKTERPDGWRLYDMLHPEPLEALVHHRIAWPQIASNLAKGTFDALSVSTTRIRDGRTEVFVQRREPGLPEWSRDPWTVATEVVLGPEHALASAAIPLLFRSVKVGDEYYCDGFVRQNTPVSPALRLGADRLLILSLRHTPRVAHQPPKLLSLPSTLQIVGKVLNALMLDRLDHDLDRLRRVNALVKKGRDIGGDLFVQQLGAAISAARGVPYRFIRELVVRPSRDLADVARPHLESRAKKETSEALPTRLLHRLAGSQLFSQAEVGSYLLFDAPYARDLIELGMNDAHARREQLVEFFGAD